MKTLAGCLQRAVNAGQISEALARKINDRVVELLGKGFAEAPAMAKASGLAPSTVHRIWREHGLKPHRVETFKLSNDPKFVEKVRGPQATPEGRYIVGLCVNPPEHAIVLSVDEKRQIQALDRTQPGLPMKRGRGTTMTHNSKRHGTTTLFAALDVKAGTVISQCTLRHRAAEFIRFLRLIDKQTPAGLDLHLILDTYAAHKTEAVKRALAQHPRFHIHFTPPSASWINAVEGLFATPTKRRLKRGVFHSVTELNQAIRAYLDAPNAHPKPCLLTTPAETIIAQHERRKRPLESLQ